MRRGFAISLASVSVIGVGLVGCSSDKSAPTAGKGTTTYDGGAMTQNATATAIIDGQPHKVEGTMACTAFDDDFVISIGNEPHSVKARLTNGDTPKVLSVHLGDLAGYALVVSDVPKSGEATVTKNGKKYTIAGTASGIDTAGTVVDKPFTVELTCP